MILDKDNLTFSVEFHGYVLQASTIGCMVNHKSSTHISAKMAEMLDCSKNKCRYLCICAERKKTFAQGFFRSTNLSTKKVFKFVRKHMTIHTNTFASCRIDNPADHLHCIRIVVLLCK